jgi:hypothetical protein
MGHLLNPLIQKTTMSFQPHALLLFVPGFDLRQLVTLPTSGDRLTVINFIRSRGGYPNGDWYQLNSLDTIDSAIALALTLGGISYNLPVRA